MQDNPIKLNMLKIELIHATIQFHLKIWLFLHFKKNYIFFTLNYFFIYVFILFDI